MFEKRKVKEIFSVFDVEPVAAASLSQVHKAVMRETGSLVSVKVQQGPFARWKAHRPPGGWSVD